MARRSARPAAARPAAAWLVLAAVASAAMLAIAHGFETFGHLPPCELCLHEREGYWIALALAVVAALAARVRPALAGPAALLLGLVFAGEAGLAAYHAGVEWKWWPGPTSCTGGHGAVTSADLAVVLSGARINMVQCDQAAWRMLGLSMAGWNAVVAALLALASFTAAGLRGRRR